MIKTIIFMAIITLTTTLSNAQDIFVSINPGWGSYAMKDQQVLFDNYKKENVIGLVTDDFPGYFNFSADGFIELTKSINLGLSFNFNSTGGRFHYKDYSGKIDIQSINYCWGIGPLFELRTKILNDNVTVKYFMSAGLLNSTMRTTSFMQVNNEVLRNEKDEKSIGSLYFVPGLKVVWNYDQFNIGGSIAYFMDNDSFYKDTNIKTQWDGMRYSVNFELNITELVSTL